MQKPVAPVGWSYAEGDLNAALLCTLEDSRSAAHPPLVISSLRSSVTIKTILAPFEVCYFVSSHKHFMIREQTKFCFVLENRCVDRFSDNTRVKVVDSLKIAAV